MCFEETDLHFKNNAFKLFHYKYVNSKNMTIVYSNLLKLKAHEDVLKRKKLANFNQI